MELEDERHMVRGGLAVRGQRVPSISNNQEHRVASCFKHLAKLTLAHFHHWGIREGGHLKYLPSSFGLCLLQSKHFLDVRPKYDI
jgi:hypothetical protein